MPRGDCHATYCLIAITCNYIILLWLCCGCGFQIEQEVEHIREAHRLMEAGTMRRAGLEKALRSKLEEEVLKLKEETVCLRGEPSHCMLSRHQHTASWYH